MIEPEAEPLPMGLIAVRVLALLAVTMLVSSVALWMGIAFSGDQTGTINTGNLVQFVLLTAGVGFAACVVPGLTTVFAARFAMARSKRNAWLVVGVLVAVLIGLTMLVGLAILGSGLWGEGFSLAWPGLLVAALVSIPPAPWLVRRIRGR